MPGVQLRVSGMHCGACEKRVENALLELGNVSSAVADHESGLVKFDAAGEVDFAAIREAIEREGYELASA